MRAADAAWVELSRWQASTDEQQSGFAPLCPDFVIELRSNTDSLKEQQRKLEQWMANGARVAWLIDPVERSVTVYRAGQEPEVQMDPTSVRGDGPVGGLELILSRIWD